MAGFGDFGFDDFSFGSAAEEDPYGISPGRNTRQWWLNEPYGAKRRKTGSSYGTSVSPTGAWQGTTTRKTDSVYPNMGPDPSTTQRAILDAKQKQEDAAKLFGGAVPRDTGAGGSDDAFANDNQTFLAQRYRAPDPTNPGHQDAARQQMDMSLQDYNDYFNNKEEIKKLEDQAYALPKRTGFGGAFDRQRAAAYERAEVLRRRNAEIRAGNPKAFGGGEAGGYDPNRYATVGNLRFDNLTGKYIVPDEATLTAMHRSGITARTGRSAAAQKPFAVGDDNRLVLQDPNDPQALLPVGDKIPAQGPPTPFAAAGQDPWPSGIKQATAAKPAAVQAKEYATEHPKPGKAQKTDDNEPDPIKVQAQHNNIDARFDRRLVGARPSEAAKIEEERKKAHEDADRRMGGSGGGDGDNDPVLKTATDPKTGKKIGYRKKRGWGPL